MNENFNLIHMANLYNVVLYDEIFSSSSSSSSSSSEDDWYEDVWVQLGRVNCRCWYRRRRPRVQRYIETVVAQFNEVDFQQTFRLRRTNFEYLLRILAPHLQGAIAEFGNVPIPPEKQLLVTLWYLATPDSYRSIIQKFDIGAATALRAVDRVVLSLYAHQNFFIQWPTQEEMTRIANRIEQACGYPGVYGFCDGFHVKILKPKRNGNRFINRKHYPAIQTQVCCPPSLKFFHVFSGFPGSAHDSRVFVHSGVQQIINNSPPNRKILADSAYSLQEKVMTPYRDEGFLTLEETHYNRIASGLRQSVERAIGLLKMRWRILLDKCPLKRVHMIPYLIVACCILHNVCLIREDARMELPGAIPIVEAYAGPLYPTHQARQLGIAERHRVTRLLARH